MKGAIAGKASTPATQRRGLASSAAYGAGHTPA
jgi:hypothetical protein